MKAIGGYFELADRETEDNYPVEGVRLNTSRNALEYIIRSISDVHKIYLPLYTCEAVIQPFKRFPNIEYSFYHINERFEIVDDIGLTDGEYLIANNYFGVKDAYIAELAQKYGERLIVDNAQALFAPSLPGISTGLISNWAWASTPRNCTASKKSFRFMKMSGQIFVSSFWQKLNPRISRP